MSEHNPPGSSSSGQPPHLPVGEHAEIFNELPTKVPPLPDNATAEEKDLHWYRYVYQGDRMPQLTVRAVLMGGLLGMLMSAANLYTTLSIGWAFGIAITASVLSFVIWNFVRLTSGNRVSQMSILETACMASCASAAGYSTGSTIATMFGALVLLHDVPEGTPLSAVNTWDVTPPWVVVVFTLCTGLMGVFLAIPMKRQQINHEQLPFPSGIAAAETLRSLYSASKDAVRKAYVLVVGLFAGLLIGFLRAGEDVQSSVRWLREFFEKMPFLNIPAHLDLKFIGALYPRAGNLENGYRHAAGFAFEPSALLIAAGMIVGMRTSASMLLSSLVLYCVIGPQVAKMDADHMGRGADAVIVAVHDAAKGRTEPAEIADASAAAAKRAIDELNLIEPAPVKAAVDRSTKAALADLEATKARKEAEALYKAARSAGLNADAIENAWKRALVDAGESVHKARSGAVVAEAVRQARAKGLDPQPLRDAAEKANIETSIATDKEVGEAVLAAVISAAEQQKADVARVRQAGENARQGAKVGPWRAAAAAAKAEAVKIVYDEMENDPAPIHKAAEAVATPANEAAAKKVSDAIIAAVTSQAASMGLDRGALDVSGHKAATSAEQGQASVIRSAAVEAATFEANQKKADLNPLLGAMRDVEFTPEEREENLKHLREGIIGGPAAAAASGVANRKAIEEREAALAAARQQNLTFKKTKEAGEAAYNEHKYRANLIWDWGGGQIVLTRWSLWGGTSIMVFASLMSVALQWRTIVRAFKGARASASATAAEAGKMEAIEVPGSWMVVGMIPITIAMVWLQIQAFNVSWYAGVIAVAMSFVLSLVASRATGETDTTPVGAMGKVMQLLFAILAPNNMHANLASAGIAANSASSSADLLMDLKTGYLLGANPRRQFLAQFFGVFFGTIAIVPIWYLMVPTREKLESFALPATRAWEAVARVLVKGIGELPASAIWAIFIGAAIGIILPLVERFTPANARKWLPSATAMGLAWVIPFQNAFSFFIGACIAMLWFRVHKKSQENYNVPIASGLVAGESLMAAALAITATVVGLLAAR
ncbi:MAG TPA: OPT/YSL family transporter [Phycisphaerales bacterium]|nr:OPT/YSL family transporter [Phycisphaerales bacterium]